MSSTSGYATLGMPEAFLAIFIPTPGESAWCWSSHASHSASEANAIWGSSSAATGRRLPDDVRSRHDLRPRPRRLRAVLRDRPDPARDPDELSDERVRGMGRFLAHAQRRGPPADDRVAPRVRRTVARPRRGVLAGGPRRRPPRRRAARPAPAVPAGLLRLVPAQPGRQQRRGGGPQRPPPAKRPPRPPLDPRPRPGGGHRPPPGRPRPSLDPRRRPGGVDGLLPGRRRPPWAVDRGGAGAHYAARPRRRFGLVPGGRADPARPHGVPCRQPRRRPLPRRADRGGPSR